MKNKRIGMIGMGLMGLPMAKHLMNAGYAIGIHSRTKSKAQELIEKGCTWYDTPSGLTENIDVLITMIGTPDEVKECYFGANGIIHTLKSGTILIDMTTTKPSLSVDIYERTKLLGAHFIDAPVSGGELGAIEGTLSIMIGGDKDIVDQIEPIFKILGKNIVYQGAPGSGQHTKMCNQITIAGTLIGVCEGLIYGVKAGLDLNSMLTSISKGAAGCWSLDVLAPKIINDDYSPGFTITNFLKDLNIALEEAEAMRLALPGLALAKQLYMAVVAMDKGNLGNQALFLTLKKLSNMDHNIDY